MQAARKMRTDEDWAALRHEILEKFTPSAPVTTKDLFAGRAKQLIQCMDVVAERGRHGIIYGEPGVGKTSISQVIRLLVPIRTSSVRYIRKAAFSSDTFSTIWTDVFREMKFFAGSDGERVEYAVSDLYSGGVKPSDVVRELSLFNENDVPIIVIDEFNLVRDGDAPRLMAETIKALSDAGVKATLFVVGISDSVAELIEGHQSIIRCTEEILMPRMHQDEMRDVLEGRLRTLGMSIEGDAKWKIINLTKGLPAFAHGMGKEAALAAIRRKSLKVSEADVDASIDRIVDSNQNTLKTDYQRATHSNQARAKYKEILTACAQAQSNEIGYFTPKQVEEPLSAILGRKVTVEFFNRNLKEFTEDRRGKVLHRHGDPRIFRYRFENPAMQPFIIMKGVRDGLLDQEAMNALSQPEQADFFANEP